MSAIELIELLMTVLILIMSGVAKVLWDVNKTLVGIETRLAMIITKEEFFDKRLDDLEHRVRDL